MFKGSLITLTTAGAKEKLAAGRIELPKGKAMRGARFKASVTIANTRASSVTTPLTAAQKKDLLANFLWNMRYGAAQQHQPYKALPGNRLRVLQRYLIGSEMEGWSNSTTGLAQNLVNTSSTTTVVFYPVLPTGYLHQLRKRRKLFGVGRSQAKTIEIEVSYLSRQFTSDAGLQISGNVTLELMPDVIPCKGDQWTPLPHYTEYTEKDKTFTASGESVGLPLLLMELSAAHASSTLTNFSVFVDGEVVHDQVTASEAILEQADNSELLSEADVSDEATLLYAIQPGDELETLPTGALKFVQNVKNLSEAQLGVLAVPVHETPAGKRDIAEVAKLRNKVIRAVSVPDVQGFAQELPNRLRFALPWKAVDRDDREFEQFPGFLAEPNNANVVEGAPDSVLAAGRAAYAEYRSRGETKLAAGIAERMAAAHPYAVQSPRGFKGGGSSVLANIVASLQ